MTWRSIVDGVAGKSPKAKRVVLKMSDRSFVTKSALSGSGSGSVCLHS